MVEMTVGGNTVQRFFRHQRDFGLNRPQAHPGVYKHIRVTTPHMPNIAAPAGVDMGFQY